MSDSGFELYQSFIEFVRKDIQGERKLANRRMFGVFLWCFIAPAFTTLVFVLALRLGYIPRRFGRYTDWIIVAFPVIYAVYVLSFDLLREIPTAYRRGGVAATLGRGLEEARWRSRVCEDLHAQFLAKNSSLPPWSIQWPWLVKSFQTDLENLQHRTRYLTALAGAVFFLLLKGLDFLDFAEPMSHLNSINSPANAAGAASIVNGVGGSGGYILGWFESSTSNAAQFTGLALFLVMLYLSGNQAYVSLARYLHCLELVQIDIDQASGE